MLEEHGEKPLNEASVLDLGCGMGRISLPFSKVFKNVVGVDINEGILAKAKEYTSEAKNIEFYKNNGTTIPLSDNSFDYLYCGGVLQHIPNIDVVTNYFREGLRVLKPGGILNFSVQVWMVLRKGGVLGDRVGAQIRSSDIEKILNDLGHELITIYFDDKDPIPHYNILIKKNNDSDALEAINKRKKTPFVISPAIVQIKNCRTGIFEDLESYSDFKRRWAAKKSKQNTFFNRGLKTYSAYVFQAVLNKIK